MPAAAAAFRPVGRLRPPLGWGWEIGACARSHGLGVADRAQPHVNNGAEFLM
jgi:hypothetical protein